MAKKLPNYEIQERIVPLDINPESMNVARAKLTMDIVSSTGINKEIPISDDIGDEILYSLLESGYGDDDLIIEILRNRRR